MNEEQKRILDATGKQISPAPSLREQIDLAVKSRIIEAEKDLEKHVDRLVEEKVDPIIAAKNLLMFKITIGTIAFAIFFSMFAVFYGNDWFKRKAAAYIEATMIKTNLQVLVDKVIAEQSTNFINNKIEPLETRVSFAVSNIPNLQLAIDKANIEANNYQKNAEDISMLLTNALLANADNRWAWETLRTYTTNAAFPHKDIALRIWQTTADRAFMDCLYLRTTSSDERNNPWNDYPKSVKDATFEDYTIIMQNKLKQQRNCIYFIRDMCDNKRLTEYERATLLIVLLKSSASLLATELALEELHKISKVDRSLLAIEDYYLWYEKYAKEHEQKK